jgi:NTP pyrophosphatase (non-canonical NTP hydrolase)
MKDYIEQALRTESGCNPLGYERDSRLLHAAMGLVDEAGEFNKVIKAYLFYNQHFDKINLVEELGDMLWFVAIALDALDSSFEEAMLLNINKLRVRYPDKFDEQCAQVRDLAAEGKALGQDN